MAIFRLSDEQQTEFARYPEILPGVQLGFITARNFEGQCIIVCDQVAVRPDGQLFAELDVFFTFVWRRRDGRPLGADDIETVRPRYTEWMGSLIEAGTAEPQAPVLRRDLMAFATGTMPPPSPNRAVLPGAPHGRGTLPITVGHLPFHTITEPNEIFYRWEAWPTSKRINQAAQTVDPWTFAAPEAEEKLIETGFAAVGRAALPSFFPHVFEWKLEPPGGTSMLCGAVVPMFGQAGGGVEVCFDVGATNTPSAQVIIEPL